MVLLLLKRPMPGDFVSWVGMGERRAVVIDKTYRTYMFITVIIIFIYLSLSSCFRNSLVTSVTNAAAGATASFFLVLASLSMLLLYDNEGMQRGFSLTLTLWGKRSTTQTTFVPNNIYKRTDPLF